MRTAYTTTIPLTFRNEPIQASAAATAPGDELAAGVQSRLAVVAKEAVERAVKRGAIPSRDYALQAAWTNACMEDPTMVELLDPAHGHPALENS